MNEPLYTVEEAAKKLGITTNGIYQLAINGELRMGINARGWWGHWLPQREGYIILEHVDSGHSGFDENGRELFSHTMPSGEVIELLSFRRHHFWYINFSELYELLTSSGRSPKEITFYEARTEIHKELLKLNPPQVTHYGAFWAKSRHNGKEQDLTVRIDDLLIPASELVKKTHNEKSQDKREKALEELILECGLENLVKLGRSGVWEKLKRREPHLFSASSVSTISKFYERQSLIAFKPPSK